MAGGFSVSKSRAKLQRLSNATTGMKASFDPGLQHTSH